MEGKCKCGGEVQQQAGRKYGGGPQLTHRQRQRDPCRWGRPAGEFLLGPLGGVVRCNECPGVREQGHLPPLQLLLPVSSTLPAGLRPLYVPPSSRPPPGVDGPDRCYLLLAASPPRPLLTPPRLPRSPPPPSPSHSLACRPGGGHRV